MAQSFIPITPVALTVGGSYDWDDINVRPYGVPANATGVVLHARNGSGVARDYGIRCNGNIDTRNGSCNMGNWHTWAVVGIDANGVFEFFNVDAAPRIDIDLVGYTLEGVDFSLSAISAPDISSAVGAWTAVDLRTFGVPDTAIGAIVEVYNSGVGGASFGYRQNGSADARIFSISPNHTTFSFVVGCDANQVIELYRGHVVVEFYLHGYITDGATFYLNAVDVTPAATGVWTDRQLPVYGIMAFLEVSGVGGQFAAREPAVGPNDYLHTSVHSFAIPGAPNRNYQVMIQNVGANFHLIGYSRYTPTVPAGLNPALMELL